jgi:mono/diheme cytochrome c family protein
MQANNPHDGKEMMKKTQIPVLLALLALSLLAVACNQPYIEPTSIPTLIPATLPAATPTEVVVAPEETEAAPEEAESPSSEDTLAAGQEVFETLCAVCHSLGDEAIVGPGLAGLFEVDELPNGNPFNEENLREWIVTGGGAMPGMPLTEEQLDALIPFLREATQQ